ncbi:hypothetical protein [Nocardioides convexus]|uniref:hypothetical protein n=1 Tax=Nocardioides convexus TaxID=2712224 RepID=UPI0024181D80|nr:hypothetical protein [Nocardioides convexus]
MGWRTGAVVVVVAVSVLVGMMVLARGAEEDKPHPKPPAKPTLTELDFAVWGSKEEIAAYQSVVDDYNAASKDTRVKVSSRPSAESMLADVRAGKAKPDLYLLPRSESGRHDGGEAQPAAPGPRQRAGDPDRRRLRPGGRRGVLGRRRPAVHAVHGLADGHLLQQGARRLRRDEGPGPAGPEAGPLGVELQRVPGRGGVRQPAARRHPRGLHRAHPARPRAVHLLRRRRGLRRRHPADQSRARRGRLDRRAAPDPGVCCATRG